MSKDGFADAKDFVFRGPSFTQHYEWRGATFAKPEDYQLKVSTSWGPRASTNWGIKVSTAWGVKVGKFIGSVNKGLAEGGGAAARAMQAEIVSRVPVHTGRLQELFGSPEAIAPMRKVGYFRVGLVSPSLRSQASYAWYIEYGTKEMYTGLDPFSRLRSETDTLVYTDSHGRPLFRRKLKALDWSAFTGKGRKPARPFFRPAREASRDTVKSLIAGAVKAALGR